MLTTLLGFLSPGEGGLEKSEGNRIDTRNGALGTLGFVGFQVRAVTVPPLHTQSVWTGASQGWRTGFGTD